MNTAPELQTTIYQSASSTSWIQLVVARHLLWERKLGYALFSTGLLIFVISAGTAFINLPYTNGVAFSLLLTACILLKKGILLGFHKTNRIKQQLLLHALPATEMADTGIKTSKEAEIVDKARRENNREESFLYILLVINLILFQVTEKYPFWKGMADGALGAVVLLLFINSYRIFMHNRVLKEQSYDESTN